MSDGCYQRTLGWLIVGTFWNYFAYITIAFCYILFLKLRILTIFVYLINFGHPWIRWMVLYTSYLLEKHLVTFFSEIFISHLFKTLKSVLPLNTMSCSGVNRQLNRQFYLCYTDGSKRLLLSGHISAENVQFLLSIKFHYSFDLFVTCFLLSVFLQGFHSSSP